MGILVNKQQSKLEIAAQEIRTFKEHQIEGVPTEPENLKFLPYFIYRLRWDIEVIFYEHKFFCSFGKYMVRTQAAIERYVNLIGIAFAFVQILAFISIRFEDYKFQSPQVIKHTVADQLSQELILGSFVQSLESNKIYFAVAHAIRIYKKLEFTEIL